MSTTISPQIQSQYQSLLTRHRKSMSYGRTTLARALDKGTFVRGLRKWTLPVLGVTSLGWVGYEALKAEKGDKLKTIVQIGLGALGTFWGAWYGFKKMAPDPHTAGAIGKLALEHLQVLLKKADLEKLAFKSEDLLEKSLHDLNLGHLFGDIKPEKLKTTTLDDVIEDMKNPQEVLEILENRLGLNLGNFRQTLLDTMNQAKTFDKGLPEDKLQEFRIKLLKHVFDTHDVPFPNTLQTKLNQTVNNKLSIGNAKALRQELEDQLDHFKEWADEIGLHQMDSHRNKKGKVDPKGFVTKRLKRAKDLLNTIIPGPGNISSKEMMGEIVDLSRMGLAPVAGGVAGGTLGDALTGEDWGYTIKAKSKEGLFQFLANIMLCNVGAMAFLGATELTAGSKWLPQKLTNWAGEYSTRFGAMVAGIVTVGVVGGSFLANLIGENVLNPLIESGPRGMVNHLRARTKEDGLGGLFKDLYAHRHPEVLDVMLHIDDFATGAAISGLSFVEPFLALLYAFSGVRASIGYRNDGEQYTSEQLKLAQGHLSLLKKRLEAVPAFQKAAKSAFNAHASGLATQTAQQAGPAYQASDGVTSPQNLSQRFVYFSA